MQQRSLHGDVVAYDHAPSDNPGESPQCLFFFFGGGGGGGGGGTFLISFRLYILTFSS